MSSDEHPATEPATGPQGRYLTNWALIFAAMTLFMPLGIFGPIGLVLAILGYRRGDRERGRIAMIAVTAVVVIRILLIIALRPGPAPAV